VSLLVVDTLARNFGGGDENSNRDMSLFVAVLDDLKSRYGCSVLLVHHSGHGDAGRGRGASALKGAVDAEFGVRRDGEQRSLLFCTKMKDAPKPHDVAFTIEVVEIGQTADGTPLTGPVLVETTAVAAVPKAALSDHERWVVAAVQALTGESGDLRDSPVQRDDLRDQCFETLAGVQPATKRKRFGRALAKLLGAGALVEVEGGFVLAPDFRLPDSAAFVAFHRSSDF
jgi:hypothetical protein